MSQLPALALLLLLGGACAQVRYYGKELGPLSQLQHGVKGTVYAVDSRTLFIKDLHYDGEGPTAYFYVGTSGAPSNVGATRLRDERGGAGPLRKYRGESVTISLPDGKTLKDFRWFSIYCDEYAVNFGDVTIPRNMEYPRPAKVAALRGVHGVSSDPVVVVDAQTLLVPNFSYDGEAPDAKFWVGRGDKPSPQGIRIPDENGKEVPLRKYDKKTIVLTLPGELTVFDIGHFAVWCEAFTVNFGHVTLPRAALANVPPSLKMLGVSPQSKLNCEVLYDDLAFEVRWAVAGDSIVLQLVAKLEDGEYMSFGVSGDNEHTQMVGGDVVVAWVDKDTLKGHAVDYYLDAKSQCAGVRGSCPDDRLGGEKTNSIRLLNAALVNGYSIVTYQRSLKAADELDRPVLTNASQPILWAVGPLNSRNEVSYHHHFTKGDKLLEFGRPPVWNCPMPEDEDEAHEQTPAPARVQQTQKVEQKPVTIKPNPVPTPKPVPKAVPWDIPAIQCYEPPDGVFYAQMGPTGGKQGYSAITGHVGWGISWYINGLLIPEINVVRGRKYTFVVEGGSDPEVPARYHPFYITNDPVGGYFHKSEKEKQGVEIYAGVRRTRSGDLNPVGVGRLCNWTPDKSGPDADEYPSFGAYQRSLTLVCEEGNPGVVTWTPDKNTPDTVYYQCFTHRHLGWKINVLDECDASEGEESRVSERVVAPDADLHSEESVQVQTRLTPDRNFLDQRKKVQKIINTKTYDDFSSFKQQALTGEVFPPGSNAPFDKPEYELPISKGQLEDVIQTVEGLETRMKEDMKRNITQYQVHEDIKDSFGQEQPVREDDEYFYDHSKAPEVYFLPANQKPLTLQTVLRPNSGPNSKPVGNGRPPFRRPVPPEIKLRRPPPQYQKGHMNYPLPMPNHHTQPHGQPHAPAHGPPHAPPHGQPHGPSNSQPHGPAHAQQHNPQHSQPHAQSHAPPHAQQHAQPSKKVPVKYAPNRPPSTRLQVPNIPPMKAMPPLHHHNKPNFNQLPAVPISGLKAPNGPVNSAVQSIITGKPIQTVNLPQQISQSQTLNLGQTDIIANQVVKSQIILPGSSDSVAQHSTVQTYFNKPGQIILGKPMDNPQPLDQQMTPTKQLGIKLPGSTPQPPFHQHSNQNLIITPPVENQSQNEIKSSDFMGESSDPSTYTPAVNTGFKPDSIVVESGFKPIIREPLMAGEDRITDYGDGNSNRREDTDVEEDYEESPQYISNHHVVPSDKLTETFEPMFIPSPEDHLLPSEDKKSKIPDKTLAVSPITKEVFPLNHAKEDRPHPVYIKTETELNALFSKKNMEKDVPSDLMMESDKVSPHYLPPDPKLPKEHSQKLSSDQTFTTYDGKTVSAATLTSIPDSNTKPLSMMKLFSAKLPANTELLLKSPQFGPFKGEIPSLLVDSIKDAEPKTSNIKTTKLNLVNAHKPEDTNISDLKTEASETDEVVILEKHDDENRTSESEEDEYDEEEYEEDEEEDIKKRTRRETKTTQFEKGEIEEVKQTNGHSMPKNQVDFESDKPPTTGAAYKLQSSWTIHTMLLLLCYRFM